MNYIACAEDESEESTELPLEPDGTLAMSTLQAQYPGASGLKFRSPETGSWRGLRVTDGKVYQADNDWGTYLYITVYPKHDNKRRGEMEVDDTLANSKSKRLEIFKRCTDLIVLGLPWKITETELKEYFEQFGEVAMTQIKREAASGKSKGYGFIKFKEFEVQQKVVAQRHNIDGRWCDVRIPNSKGGETECSKKIFVGRVSEDLTKADLKDYFSQFGDVTDVFVPKPHRAFAFVTFADAYVAQQLQAEGDDHLIKNCSVSISNATAKGRDHQNARNQMGGNHQHGGSGGGGGGFGFGNSGQGMGGGGGGGPMDMSNMMNPAMMMQMMQMMMMSNAGASGGSGGGGGGGGQASSNNAGKNGGGSQGVIGDRFGGGGAVGGGGAQRALGGNDFGKREGGSFGWSSDGKSYGGSGGGGGGGWGTGSAWN